jgi:6-phospho-beta-glucosidase
MKLVIVGGGSSYTPELIDGLIQHKETFPVDEICLTDINEQRLDILAGLSRRMIARAGVPVQVTATTDRREALDGADFVNCLIRVGGMDARIQDEKIPLKYGVIGQETTGPGGMMKALRTIPVMLELANDMVAACPQAWLINYTNPSGIMAEALGKYTRVKFLSLCSGPAGWIGSVLRRMNVSPERANVEWIGLNHLGFLTRVWVDGVDATEQAIEAAAESWNVDPEWIRSLGAIPASYLRYFFHTGLVLEEYRQPGHQTRGEVVKEIEAELLRQYADPNLSEKPELLRRRGGGGYSDVAIGAMKAIYANTGERQVVQVLNGGAVEDLPTDASIEAACVVDKTGAHPLHYGCLPLPIRGLIQAVKAYESLTVQAAVERSKRVALQAMMAHPLVPGWEVAKPLFEELLQANKRWIDWA